ncbi:hypothetical protein [Paenibacillus sp. KN14-4R]|uniref:hypothetical protein n=1 Tax=Paenibacillus sp. KN14-4R TaxID=3445773 RepID=UPI003FA07D9F
MTFGQENKVKGGDVYGNSEAQIFVLCSVFVYPVIYAIGANDLDLFVYFEDTFESLEHNVQGVQGVFFRDRNPFFLDT